MTENYHFINKTKSDYTLVDNGLINHPKLSMAAKFLFIFLKSKSSGLDFSAENLASVNSCKLDQISICITELLGMGLISKRRSSTTTYYLLNDFQAPVKPEKVDLNLNSDSEKLKPQKDWSHLIELKYKTSEFVLVWLLWLDHLKKKKKPLLTESRVKFQLNKLYKYPVSEAIRMIGLAIAFNWEGIFPIRDDESRKSANEFLEANDIKLKSFDRTLGPQQNGPDGWEEIIRPKWDDKSSSGSKFPTEWDKLPEHYQRFALEELSKIV